MLTFENQNSEHPKCGHSRWLVKMANLSKKEAASWAPMLPNKIIAQRNTSAMKSKPEYEANIVAAEILMDSDEVLRYIFLK